MAKNKLGYFQVKTAIKEMTNALDEINSQWKKLPNLETKQ